jgi:WD40 repeat protein
VAILGIGGVGKTTLAAAIAKAVAADFDNVIWRSLLNAPPLDELLRGVLLSIAQQPLADLPLSLDEQLAWLLSALRRQRCLLVLDNLESILQPEGIGQMRAGYEGYTHLIRRLAENRHNSSLLLTSRERPHSLARLEADLPWVRCVQVEGLDATAGQAILTARGLGGHSTDGYALVQRYSGHPLALKLVAQTIQEIFAGDIGAFLASDVVIFDDIRRVLDEQFARLSDLQREVLIWLAIEREAIPVQTLHKNLLRSAASQAVLEAVRSLQRRSLLERSGAGVTLQNVIIEYTTAYLVEQVSQEIECSEEIDGRDTHSTAQSALSSSFLNRFALLKAQAKEYIRQSQARLILQPLAERLQQRLGTRPLQSTLRALLERLRSEIARSPGYAGGNLLNLVRQLGFNLADYNFSQLSVWQADFRELVFAPVNLAHADLSHCAFMLTFDLQAIRFSASGQVLVAGVVDGAICLWRAAGGQLHHTLRSDDANASSPVVISPDGQWLASGGQDHMVHIWSAEHGTRLHSFTGHTDGLHALAISGDGSLVASSSYDGTIRIWDVHRGQLRHALYEHVDAMSALAFHPDGVRLASGGGERIICMWDIESGRLVQTLSGHLREIECLAFSGDGRLLVSGAHDGTICLWDVASGQRLRTLEGHTHIVRALLLHSDGRLLASGGVERVIRLWDLQSGELLHSFIGGHTNEVKALSFSPDGLMLASGGKDNVVQLWDTHTGHALSSLRGHTDMVRSVRFNPTGNLLASSGGDSLVRLWHLRPYEDSVAQDSAVMRGQIVKYLQGHVGDIRCIAFHPAGRLLASGGSDHMVQLWDVESGKSVHTLRGHSDAIKALAFSPDGRWLASGGTDRTIRLWPMGDATAVNGQGGLVLHGHDDHIQALAFSPDGRTLVSGSLDHTARLWAIDSGRELHILRGHHHALSGAVFSPDGQLVVTSSYDNSILVWDAVSGQRSDRWLEHAARALVVAFHPNGELFACITAEQTIEVRLVSTGMLLHTLSGHTKPILSLDFSPSVPILASGGWDSAIRLWNTETGAYLASLHSPGPYAGMNITGVTGITEAQKAALKTLGAYE